ncbi:hypothetical protein RIF29_23734 [Crotalaria pallida]|uniref:Uncharacterized protein n=1 Tax=Crotalaria pallida TaxID=3830 RepID=A0AAN9F5V5_CROPI
MRTTSCLAHTWTHACIPLKPHCSCRSFLLSLISFSFSFNLLISQSLLLPLYCFLSPFSSPFSFDLHSLSFHLSFSPSLSLLALSSSHHHEADNESSYCERGETANERITHQGAHAAMNRTCRHHHGFHRFSLPALFTSC